MELKDTIELMASKDYKDRFKAEYYQLLIRYKKLKDMLDKHSKGELEFTPTCPISVLEEQLLSMIKYKNMLVMRAEIEGIVL